VSNYIVATKPTLGAGVLQNMGKCYAFV